MKINNIQFIKNLSKNMNIVEHPSNIEDPNLLIQLYIFNSNFEYNCYNINYQTNEIYSYKEGLNTGKIIGFIYPFDYNNYIKLVYDQYQQDYQLTFSWIDESIFIFTNMINIAQNILHQAFIQLNISNKKKFNDLVMNLINVVKNIPIPK